MLSITDQIAILFFNALAFLKGYRFKEAKTASELKDFETAYKADGFYLPSQLDQMMKEYKSGATHFIAYYRGKAVGTVRLGNPNVKNRPFELHGLDEKAEHFEIQNLMVRKEYRDGSQFVMLGLFKAMYVFSKKNNVFSWISGSTRSVYQTMRRYNKKIEILEHNYHTIRNPLTDYLYANNILDFHYTMRVADFSPKAILKKFISKLSRQIKLFPQLETQVAN